MWHDVNSYHHIRSTFWWPLLHLQLHPCVLVCRINWHQSWSHYFSWKSRMGSWHWGHYTARPRHSCWIHLTSTHSSGCTVHSPTAPVVCTSSVSSLHSWLDSATPYPPAFSGVACLPFPLGGAFGLTSSPYETCLSWCILFRNHLHCWWKYEYQCLQLWLDLQLNWFLQMTCWVG